MIIFIELKNKINVEQDLEMVSIFMLALVTHF